MPALTGTPLALMDYVGHPDLTILLHLGKNIKPPEELSDLVLTEIEELVAPGYAPIQATSWVIDDESGDDVALARPEPIDFEFGAIVTPVYATFAYTTFKLGAGAAVLGKIFPFEHPERIDTPGQTLSYRFSVAGIDLH